MGTRLVPSLGPFEVFRWFLALVFKLWWAWTVVSVMPHSSAFEANSMIYWLLDKSSYRSQRLTGVLSSNNMVILSFSRFIVFIILDICDSVAHTDPTLARDADAGLATTFLTSNMASSSLNTKWAWDTLLTRYQLKSSAGSRWGHIVKHILQCASF